MGEITLRLHSAYCNRCIAAYLGASKVRSSQSSTVCRAINLCSTNLTSYSRGNRWSYHLSIKSGLLAPRYNLLGLYVSPSAGPSRPSHYYLNLTSCFPIPLTIYTCGRRSSRTIILLTRTNWYLTRRNRLCISRCRCGAIVRHQCRRSSLSRPCFIPLVSWSARNRTTWSLNLYASNPSHHIGPGLP